MDWKDKLNALKSEFPSTDANGADENSVEGTNDTTAGKTAKEIKSFPPATGEIKLTSEAGTASIASGSAGKLKSGISEAMKAKQKEPLRIEMDKRKGKPSTIISGFLGTDDELKELAKMLKVKCSAGGSSRDGEVLIQGDFRKKTAELLVELGYKIKRINF